MSCAQEKTTFDEIALTEKFEQLNGDEISFKSILDKHKGKTIFIDIWASWCHDCVGSLPDFKKLQAKEKEVVYVMLSLDKTAEAWKKGLKKHELSGEQYLFTKKWKESDFCSSIKLDWIPRYLIVGKDGTVKMYKAIKVKSKKIKKVIKADK